MFEEKNQSLKQLFPIFNILSLRATLVNRLNDRSKYWRFERAKFFFNFLWWALAPNVSTLFYHVGSQSITFSYSCLTLPRSITFFNVRVLWSLCRPPLCNFLFLKPKVLRVLHALGPTKKGFLLIRTEFSGLIIPESIVFYCKKITGLTVYIENALNKKRAHKWEKPRKMHWSVKTWRVN